MKINKVVLNSFGKFQNKAIEFSDGVNIVIGDNESGKTTIHRFIQGMYFGFYKGNLKTKKNNELYDQYLPWDNNVEYYGSLILEDNDEEVRIERNFLKDCDKVDVFDNITGDKINNRYEYNPVTKMVTPGEKHFLMNQSTYENTVSISQMNNVTSNELINEIKENLLNLSETKSLNISVSNAMKNIGEKKSNIGTERSKKSPYGKLFSKINDLKKQKDELKSGYKNLKDLQAKEHILLEDLKVLEDKKLQIEKQLKYFNRQERTEKYEQALALQNEIETLSKKIQALKPYEQISKDRVEENLTNYKNKEILENKITQTQGVCDDLANQVNEINKRLNEFDQSNDNNPDENTVLLDENDAISPVERIAKDIYKYEGLESSKVYIEQGFSESELEMKDTFLKKNMASKKVLLITSILSLIVVIALSGLVVIERASLNLEGPLAELKNTLHNYHMVLLVLLVIGVLAFLLSIGSYLFKLKWIKDILKDIDELKSNKNIVNMRLSETDNKKELILKKYNVETYDELVELQKVYADQKVEYDDIVARKKQYKNSLDQLEVKFNIECRALEALKGERTQLCDSIEKINDQYNVSAEEELKKALELNYEFKQYMVQKNDKTNMFLQLTKGEPLGSLVVEDDIEVEGVTKTYEEYEKDLDVVLRDIIDKNRLIADLHSEVINKESIYNQSILVEEELSVAMEDLEQKRFKFQTLELIEDTIEDIAGRIQNNFAPQLNAELSKVISIATDYKYTEVKVNPNMEISVIDNDTNKIVNVNSLSAGTMDLMYFSLRIALSDMITKRKSIPILLDDSFVQYDDNRFKNILTVLKKFDRQIIIFTCHKREKKLSGRILEDMNIIRI